MKKNEIKNKLMSVITIIALYMIVGFSANNLMAQFEDPGIPINPPSWPPDMHYPCNDDIKVEEAVMDPETGCVVITITNNGGTLNITLTTDGNSVGNTYISLANGGSHTFTICPGPGQSLIDWKLDVQYTDAISGDPCLKTHTGQTPSEFQNKCPNPADYPGNPAVAFEGPYWDTIRHPMNGGDCWVVFQYCIRFGATPNLVPQVYIGEMYTFGDCSIEQIFEIQYIQYVPHFLEHIMAKYDLTIPPCDDPGANRRIVRVGIMKCKTGLIWEQNLNNGLGGYAFRNCGGSGESCQYTVYFCWREYPWGGRYRVVDGLPSPNTANPCGTYTNQPGQPHTCYGYCE